ncbi:unnamed protein product [Paramecium sonneborni]|uniref:H-type lectin domain-containing protein n=1 Tax=Paramecium sonneborni TaxID=65129 RepID=A0A8S1R4H5_9CILI|nr:unnamed protein product [Paramecium sonneborni]
MNNKIIWLIIFLQIQAYIVYDVGWLTFQTHLEGFNIVKTIEFKQSFRNPPQIFFTLQYIVMYNGGNEYQFFCESINTKSFTIRMISVGQIPTGLTYLYQAYDDMRIEIINVFNLAQPKGNTYPHKNANAQNAILSLISLGCTGPIDFKIALQKIQQLLILIITWQAKLKIQNKQVSKFSLGLKKQLKVLKLNLLINLICSLMFLMLIQFPEINMNLLLLIKDLFMILLKFFRSARKLLLSIQIKLLIIQYILHILIHIQVFYKRIIIALVFTPCTSLEVFIIKYFKTIFTPLKLYSAIVTQKRDLIFLNNPQIYIKIEILNKIITQPQIYETLIDKSIKTFSIQIEINCKNIVQIKSLFRNCQNCLFQQNYHSNHYCSSNLTLLTFNFKLTQSILSYQQLIFIVEQSRFTLKQVLTNYVETEVELIDIILV